VKSESADAGEGPQTQAAQQVTEVRVRWNECDPAGIVYFPNYFTYFELGSMDFLRARREEWQALRERYGVASFPRVEATARYRISARFDDVLEVHTRVGDVARKVITFEFQLFRQPDRALLAEGQIKTVCTNAERRAMVLPPELVAWFRGAPLAGDAAGAGEAAGERAATRPRRRPIDLAPPDA
jgi:acyl-CoA thioester hydrolase